MRVRQRSRGQRILASIMLASFALSLTVPSLATGLAVSRDCPLAPTSGHQGSVVVNPMTDGTCEHTGAGPCLGALGCVTAPPVIAIVPTFLVVPNNLIVLVTRSAAPFGDLFRTGPPTPPPNLT